MPTTRITPDWNTTSGWYGVLPPVPSREVSGDMTVDWAVIGAGVTGLGAARQLGLNKPNDKIALIEAVRFGDGVSGRNSGFVLGIWFRGTPTEEEIPHIRNVQKLNDNGRTWLDQLVQENQIQCQWSHWGQVYMSAGEDGDQKLAAYQKGLEKLGHPHRVFTKEDARKATGSDFYKWGVHTSETILTNPAAMCQGLAMTMPANVDARDRSPVLRVDRTANGFELTCPKGKVRAKQILLCTNNFAPLMGFGFAKYKMVPGGIYASLTRPLTDAELKDIGNPGEFGVLPASMSGSTVRITQDRRIMMRNSYNYRPSMRFRDSDIANARANHRDSIRKRWPSLANIEIEHTWGGILAGTRNNGNVWGRMEPGLYASLCCNGANVARGTAAGRLLADYACGGESEMIRVQQAIPTPNFVPPHPVLAVFALRRMARMLGANTAER